MLRIYGAVFAKPWFVSSAVALADFFNLSKRHCLSFECDLLIIAREIPVLVSVNKCECPAVLDSLGLSI